MPDTEIEHAFRKLESLRRPASVATAGGFRPSEDPLASWFIRGVGLPGETLPEWKGMPMFPLLQVRVDELPFVPDALQQTAMLVLFHNSSEHVLDTPHGEGWLIREYPSFDGLQPLPAPDGIPWRPFPIRWDRVEDDLPGWEDAWSLMDMKAINRNEQASSRFFNEYQRHNRTKFGGYPTEVQHRVGVEDFVFQVETEPKVGWMWGDRGIGYFHRAPGQDWRLSCQFL